MLKNFGWKRLTKVGVLGMSILLLSGCASRAFYVDVDSISTPIAIEKKKYILLPGNKDCKGNDLQYQEFAAYTEKALQSKGFIKASNIDEAEVAILLNYGISDPQFYQYTYSVPVWGQTGISSSSTSGTVNSYSNGATYSQNTTYTPRYGVVGSSTQVGTGVLYARYLVLSGFDLEMYKKTKQIQDANEIWSTKVNSAGMSGDLRELFPVLLVTAQKHIAENTGKKVSYNVKENKKLTEKINKLKK